MDSDSTFHPASQLNLAFASPMTPMCVKTPFVILRASCNTVAEHTPIHLRDVYNFVYNCVYFFHNVIRKLIEAGEFFLQ